MDFVSIRIITNDTQRMAAFYEQVLGVAAVRYTEDFAELKTPSCTLPIAHQRTMKLFAEGIAHPADVRPRTSVTN